MSNGLFKGKIWEDFSAEGYLSEDAIVCFDTVFSIMKTMTKYLLGVYVMTDIT